MQDYFWCQVRDDISPYLDYCHVRYRTHRLGCSPVSYRVNWRTAEELGGLQRPREGYW